MDKSIEQNLEEAEGLLLEARRNYEKYDSDKSNPDINYIKADLQNKGNHGINLANHYLLKTLVEILCEKNKGTIKMNNKEKTSSNHDFEKYEDKMKNAEDQIYSLKDKIESLEKTIDYLSKEVSHNAPVYKSDGVI